MLELAENLLGGLEVERTNGGERPVALRALPVGRKRDPTFDMGDFRMQVAAIMAGTAPLPSVIPAVDSDNRPTLRRGGEGALVELIQTRIGMPATGRFDSRTDATLRQFQRDHGLVPDGIVGPRTWATLLAG